MGPAQVVDSLRGSAPAPIGWARRPPGGHTREHAWRGRPTPPPALGVSNQTSQSLPIPQSRTRGRTLSPATTVAPPRPLLPRRRPGRSSRNLLPSPRQQRRTASRRPRLHPAPLTCRVARPGRIRPRRRPTLVDRPRASQPGSPSATSRLRSSACRMWERRQSHVRAMGARRASRSPRRPRSPRVDRRLRSKEAQTGNPTPRPPTGPVARPAPRPGVSSVLRSEVGRTRRPRVRRARRALR